MLLPAIQEDIVIHAHMYIYVLTFTGQQCIAYIQLNVQTHSTHTTVNAHLLLTQFPVRYIYIYTYIYTSVLSAEH